MYVTHFEDKNGNVISRFFSEIEEVLNERRPSYAKSVTGCGPVGIRYQDEEGAL
jgi:hypothetical protein